MMKIDAFGRHLEVMSENGGWRVFDLGTEGKRRPARDIVIPDFVQKDELLGYLDDLLHEYASPDSPEIRILEQD